MSHSCRFEESVARLGRRGGEPDAELAAHLAGCPVCEDRLLVEAALAALAAPAAGPVSPRLPDPATIWRQHRRDAARRALQPIRWAERLAWAGGAAAAAIGLALAFPLLRPLAAGPSDALRELLHGLVELAAGGLSTAPLGGPPSAAALLLAGGSLAFGLALARLWASLPGETG